MDILGGMAGINLPGMSPFGGSSGGKGGIFGGDSFTSSLNPMSGFSPANPTSVFGSGGGSGGQGGGGGMGGFSSFYDHVFQFNEDLDDAESALDEWEDGWGVDPNEDLDKQSSPLFRENGVEAENRLVRIYRTRDNLRKMRTRFAGVDVTTDRPMRRRNGTGGTRVETGRGTSRSAGGININIDGSAGYRRDRPRGRVEELENDLENTAETLADLTRQIQELNRRLPPPDRLITATGEPEMMDSNENDIPQDIITPDSDSDQDLKGLSGLRQMVLEVRRMNQAQAQRKQVTFPNPPQEWAAKGTGRRTWAQQEVDGNRTNVLIEWKTIDASNPPQPHTTFTFKNMVRVKMEHLTSLLKISENVRPDGLRMLNCLGVFRKTTGEQVSYGLVSETPSKRHQSLREILAMDAGIVRQVHWMVMARSLAKAVLYLHLARLRHRGIRSSNVILFPKEDGTIDFSEPYLVGYEYSRLAGKMSLTEVEEDGAVSNLYRHPSMQGLPQDGSTVPIQRDPSPPNTRDGNGSGSGGGDGNGNGKGTGSGSGNGTGSGGSNSNSPPIPEFGRRDSWVPAPLVISRSRANSNPKAPPLLVRRDSSIDRPTRLRRDSSVDGPSRSATQHRKQNSSLDNRPSLVRRDSDREKSSFTSTHDMYGLGMVLLEMGLREPVKDMSDRAQRDPSYGKHFAEKFRQWVLANEVPRLGILVGDRYQEAVATCLDDRLDGLSDQELQKEFYSKVVRVLANITAHM